MARWAAFVGLTGVVVTALLVLARLSARVVRERDPAGRGPTRRDGRSDPTYPVFEPTAGAGTGRTRSRRETTGRSDDESLSATALLVNVAVTQGVFGAIVLAGALYFEIPLAALGIEAPSLESAPIALGIALGVVLWLGNEGASAVAATAGMAPDERLRGLLAPGSVGGWLLLLAGILPVVAGVEELIFRGALVGATSMGLGASPWALAVVSAVAFGMAHGAQGRIGIVVTGSLGFALAGAFVLTGSLLVVVVAHYVVNALELVVHEAIGIEEPLA